MVLADGQGVSLTRDWRAPGRSAWHTGGDPGPGGSAWPPLPRGSRGGRPPAFGRETCKRRNTVERCVNRLERWRGIATRYEKTATVHLAGVHIAGIFLWSAR
ncbi:hypothetical protein GCM10010272_20740 [Streptomyces lateritius]|nr:hypothetical protein GCM10010272_20740 [Streptomyces lateritius]